MLGVISLVVLKEPKDLTNGVDTLKKNHFYRCCKQGKGYIIYGTYFDKKYAEKIFEPAIERVKRDFVLLGINDFNVLCVSKTRFKKLADVRTYGKLKIVYFHGFNNETNSKVIYGFYPSQGNKTECLDECYEMYSKIMGGDFEPLDDKDVQFGDRGIPIGYGDLRVW